MGLIRIASAPGVQRDGTLFDSNSYAEAIWCRMYRGRPIKMQGFREMSPINSTGLVIASGLALTLGNAYVAGAIVQAGYIIIKDSGGTDRKVMVGT